MPQIHQEATFEAEFVEHLVARGWLEGDPALYDKGRALYTPDLLAWLQESQPEAWAKAAAVVKGDPGPALLDAVVKRLQDKGALHALRHGFKHISAAFALCQFRPGHGFNPALAARYDRVRCRVVRQVRYSLHNGNCIDLVLFVNGIPTATLELKTRFTYQDVHHATRQYRYERPPRDPLTKQEEPLLAFKRGALVHFAVSTDEVYTTTRLEGPPTRFLPFNLGCDDGQGNPPNPGGYPVAYLWERILARDAWLEILQRFVHLKPGQPGSRGEGKKAAKESLIFPRLHQWDAVTRLVAAARAEGAGRRYLVQHSAGSGKSNTIAWLAHRLATLHTAEGEKLFDSVIVITDRNVLDKQLQETVAAFEQTPGMVFKVSDKAAKTPQLAAALAERKLIIVVTIQTFPFALEAIRRTASLKERRFAVIADEAHSSQAGEAASKLKLALSAEQIEEGVELEAQDLLVASAESRTLPKNISYFAFTATPKVRTLELFGRLDADGKPQPFHLYTMRQAIEEGFILDVLRSYTPFKLAYRLAYHGAEVDEQKVERSEGLKRLARWVQVHPYNIAQKSETMVEHFREVVAPHLDGQAKAMVVTGSRLEAVRYKLAMERYIREQGYGYGVLVAFSGEVRDPESGPHPFSEANMNPALAGRDLRTAFKTPEFRLLVVANKYQTGFDEPQLVGMYVDKRLAGVAAVQTLSRLNRTRPGKEQTFILDFVNEPEEIVDAFALYYGAAALSETTDPNLVHVLAEKLDSALIYAVSEVDAAALAYFDPRGKQETLQRWISPAVERFRHRVNEALDHDDRHALDELEIFRRDLATFVHAYEFLAQLYAYEDVDLEKRHIFYKLLLPFLKVERRQPLVDLSAVELTHYRLGDQGRRTLAIKEPGILRPPAGTGALPREPEMATLAELVQQLSDLFGEGLGDANMVHFVYQARDSLLENETLVQQAQANSKEQFAQGDFSPALKQVIFSGAQSNQAMAERILTDEGAWARFAALLLDLFYEAARAKTS